MPAAALFTARGRDVQFTDIRMIMQNLCFVVSASFCVVAFSNRMIAPTTMVEGKGGRGKTPLAELGIGQANLDSAPPMDLRLHLAMKRAVVAARADAEQVERADSTAVEPKRKRKGKKKKAPLPSFLPDYVESETAPSGITHMSRDMLEDLGMSVSERAVLPPYVKPVAEPAVEDAVEPVVNASKVAASPIGEALFQRKMRFPDRRASSAVLMMLMPEVEEVAIAVSAAPMPVEALDVGLEAASPTEAEDEGEPETQAAALEQVVNAIDAAMEAIDLAIDVADAAQGGDEPIDEADAAEGGDEPIDVADAAEGGDEAIDEAAEAAEAGALAHDITDLSRCVGWEQTECMVRPLIEALPESSHATVAALASAPTTAPVTAPVTALIRTGFWPRGMLVGLARYVKRLLYGMHAISEQMRAPRLTLAPADNSKIKDA